MSFLKKIFGSSEKRVDNANQPDDSNRIPKNICDIIKLDLKSIPDETFSEGSEEINKSGDKIQNFHKRLDYLVCDLFDIVEIIKFENASKNVILKNYNLSAININNVRKLINSLYILNGPDDTRQGTFNSKDIERFYSTEFDIIFGRRWTDSKKYKQPLGIRINRQNNEIVLSIWGI